MIQRNRMWINAFDFRGGLVDYSIKYRPDWAGSSYVRSTHAARIVSRWLGANSHLIEACKSNDWLTSKKYRDEYTHCHCC